MTRRPVPLLPDLDDEDALFRERMIPLVERAIPAERRQPVARQTEHPDIRKSVKPDIHLDGNPTQLSSENPDNRMPGLVEAARQQAAVEAARGAKRRFEYLIPERVGRALASDAAHRGMSATTRLLEVLRDAGYPVIPEDLVDLRKMPKR